MANDLTFDAIIEINDRSFIPRFTSGENPGGLSNSYEDLKLLPLINDITIMGNHNGAYYKLQDKMRALTAEEIENIVDGGEIIPSPDERYVNEYMLAYYNTFVASRTDLENKVDKIPGWGLSQANFTQEEKTKLANMNAGGEVNRINAISVNGVIRPPSPAPSKTVALTIPTRTAQLQNDANFQTFNQMVTYTNNKYDILIPAQASATNQLADKDFVNSTFTSLNANRVTSNAAGDGFPTRNALLTAVIFYHGGVPYTPTQHDYALIEADEGAPSPYTGGQTRMEFDGTQWNYAYGINDRPFTAAETAAIESGITAGLVGNISEPDETPRQDSMKYVTSGGLWTEFGGNRQELETENKTIIGAINEALNATSPLSNDPNLNDPNTGLSTVGSKAIMDEVARKTPLRYATVTTLGTSPGANNLFLVGRYVNAVNNERDTITFLVNDTLLNSGADRYGILRIAIENSNVTNRAISIQWLANSGYNPDDFILAYDGVTGTNELYVRESATYQSHMFTVLSEDFLSGVMTSGKVERWELMRNPVGQASFPSGYNQVVSQRANIGMMPLRYSSIASTATEAWGQVGSLSLSGTWRDSTITLHVSEIEYNNVFIGVTRFGTLKVTLGTTGTSVFTPSALWEYVSGFNPDDTVLLYTASGTNGTFELWQRAGSTGETVRFTVIDESDTTGRPVTLWNINERPTPVSSLPTGYTIVPSTVAQLQPATGGGDGENLLVNTGGAGEEGVINTSGLTEWTAAGITINMWNHERAGQGVVTLNNGILRTERIAATANELLTQTIEASQFTQGATYTLSIRYKSNASVRFSAAIRGGSLYKDLPPSPDGFTFASLSIVAGTTLEDAVVSIYLQTSSAFVGGYFELDTTRPFAKLELGSVSTLENDSSPNYNEEFLRTTGASPTQVNPNLLGNPQGNVNQSGRTEWTSAGITVDGWMHYRAGQGTVSLTNNILRMERNIANTSDEALLQIIEGLRLIPGYTYTLSFRFISNTSSVRFATRINNSLSYSPEISTHDAIIIASWTFTVPSSPITTSIEIYILMRAGTIGDYIEFDTTRPFAKLELGSVSTLENDSSPNYNEEFLRTTGISPWRAETGGGDGKHIEVNGNFDVRQRGDGPFTSGGYTADKWRAVSSAQVSFGIDYVRVEKTVQNGANYIDQVIDFPEKLRGKTVTLSARYRSPGMAFTLNISDGAFRTIQLPASDTWKNAIYTVTLSSTATLVVLRIANSTNGPVGAYFDLDLSMSEGPAVKFELGSVSTRVNDSPVDYATELAKCQRYLRRISGSNTSVYRAVKVEPNSITFSIPLPEMRTTPTIVGTPSFTISALSGESITGFALRIISYDGECLRMQADKTNHGLTDASIYIADLLLDANL